MPRVENAAKASIGFRDKEGIIAREMRLRVDTAFP
jgi:hypothetical protein